MYNLDFCVIVQAFSDLQNKNRSKNNSRFVNCVNVIFETDCKLLHCSQNINVVFLVNLFL